MHTARCIGWRCDRGIQSEGCLGNFISQRMRRNVDIFVENLFQSEHGEIVPDQCARLLYRFTSLLEGNTSNAKMGDSII